MIQQGFWVKWGSYGAGLLPVLLCEFVLLCRLPVFGVIPVLLPLCAAAVGVLEGATGGAGFGLVVGVLADAAYPGVPGGMTVGLTLAGLGAGLVTRFGMRRGLAGYLLCAAGTLGAIDVMRVVPLLLQRAAAPAVLFSLAAREMLWSMCFAPPIYLLFLAIHRRVRGDEPIRR